MRHEIHLAGLSVVELGEDLYRELWKINPTIWPSFDDGEDHELGDYAIDAVIDVLDPTIMPLLRILRDSGFLPSDEDDDEDRLYYRFQRVFEPIDFEHSFAVEIVEQDQEMIEPAHKIGLSEPFVLKLSDAVRSLRFAVCSSVHSKSRQAAIIDNEVREILEASRLHNVTFQAVGLVDTNGQPIDWPADVGPHWEMTNTEMTSPTQFPMLFEQNEQIQILDPDDGSVLLAGEPLPWLTFIKNETSWTRSFDFACSPKLGGPILCSRRLHSVLAQMNLGLKFSPILREFLPIDLPTLRIGVGVSALS